MSPQPKPAKCVNCGKPQLAAFRPFCSKRCANLDLARWFGEGYAIPAVEEPEGIPDGPADEDQGDI
jgi:endogenous inhibitor of DNA gyrase (YacG/DUF329 family)